MIWDADLGSGMGSALGSRSGSRSRFSMWSRYKIWIKIQILLQTLDQHKWIQIPVSRSKFESGSGSRSRFESASGSRAHRLPCIHVAVERLGTRKHVIHTRDAGDVPCIHVAIEGLGTLKHPIHARDAGDVPCGSRSRMWMWMRIHGRSKS